jgi:hypothetical protein
VKVWVARSSLPSHRQCALPAGHEPGAHAHCQSPTALPEYAYGARTARHGLTALPDSRPTRRLLRRTGPTLHRRTIAGLQSCTVLQFTR